MKVMTNVRKGGVKMFQYKDVHIYSSINTAVGVRFFLTCHFLNIFSLVL